MIRSGREAEVLDLVRPYTLDAEVADGWLLDGVEIRGTGELSFILVGPERSRCILSLRPQSTGDTEGTPSFLFQVDGDPDSCKDIAAPLRDRIEANDPGEFWDEEPDPVRTRGAGTCRTSGRGALDNADGRPVGALRWDPPVPLRPVPGTLARRCLGRRALRPLDAPDRPPVSPGAGGRTPQPHRGVPRRDRPRVGARSRGVLPLPGAPRPHGRRAHLPGEPRRRRRDAGPAVPAPARAGLRSPPGRHGRSPGGALAPPPVLRWLPEPAAPLPLLLPRRPRAGCPISAARRDPRPGGRGRGLRSRRPLTPRGRGGDRPRWPLGGGGARSCGLLSPPRPGSSSGSQPSSGPRARTDDPLPWRSSPCWA